MVNFHDSFTNLYKRFFVLSWTLCMAGEQWISGFVEHQNIMVTKYQPRAMSFIFTLHNLISLNSHYLIPSSKSFFLKCTVPQSTAFLKSGHHGAIHLWINSDEPKYKKMEMFKWFLLLICSWNKVYLCTAKLWTNADFAPSKLCSNTDFAPQNHGVFLPSSAKSQNLHTFPLEIFEQCRLCSAKSRRHSFSGQNTNKKVS